MILSMLTIMLSFILAFFFLTNKLSKIPFFVALKFDMEWDFLAVILGTFTFYLISLTLFNWKDHAGLGIAKNLYHDNFTELKRAFHRLIENELKDLKIDDKKYRRRFDPVIFNQKDYDLFFQKRLHDFISNLSFRFDLISRASKMLRREEISGAFNTAFYAETKDHSRFLKTLKEMPLEDKNELEKMLGAPLI